MNEPAFVNLDVDSLPQPIGPVALILHSALRLRNNAWIVFLHGETPQRGAARAAQLAEFGLAAKTRKWLRN